jgi:hypothetical protein
MLAKVLKIEQRKVMNWIGLSVRLEVKIQDQLMDGKLYIPCLRYRHEIYLTLPMHHETHALISGGPISICRERSR